MLLTWTPKKFLTNIMIVKKGGIMKKLIILTKFASISHLIIGFAKAHSEIRGTLLDTGICKLKR